MITLFVALGVEANERVVDLGPPHRVPAPIAKVSLRALRLRLPWADFLVRGRSCIWHNPAIHPDHFLHSVVLPAVWL
jgi:hypothetical protein